MTNKIEPEFGTFSKLTTERLFVIPDYQRHYSWRHKNRQDMFSDIMQVALGHQDMHFLATIVCLDLNDAVKIGTTRYGRYSVVDGQQRITTLVALLKEIELRLATGTPDEQHEALALRKWISPDNGNVILLQANHDGNTAYADYLRNGTIPSGKHLVTRADRAIRDLITDVKEFLDIWPAETGTSLMDLLSIMKNDLYLLFQIMSDERSVYKIFEVLNSRGLSVDVLDKLKALLMGIGYDLSEGNKNDGLHQQMKQIWSEVYRHVGTGDVPGHEVVRFSATLHDPNRTARTLSTDDSLEYFSTYVRNAGSESESKKALLEICSWIRDVARASAELYRHDALRSVTRITQARLLAVAINLRTDVDDKTRSKWMNAWERATFRLYGMFALDSRSAVGDYTRLAQDIWQKRIRDSDATKKIMSIVGKEKYSITKALEQLRNQDCYNEWQTSLRYMFYRIEEYLARKEGHTIDKTLWQEIWSSRADDTIEHILPKDPSWWDTPAWRGAFTVRTKDKRYALVHCIGNLTILPQSANSRAGGKPFKEKQAIYQQNSLAIHRELPTLAGWTQKEIVHREEFLLDIAAKIWGDP